MNVSVVIPVYNAERFLAEAVRSALAQAQVREVVLVEDGSPDGSLAVCEQLAESDARVKLVRHPGGVNRGAAESRTLGVTSSNSEFVAFLDADDFFLPGRFDAAQAVFTERPDIDGVYGAVGTHYETDDMRTWWLDECRRRDLHTMTQAVEPEDLLRALVKGNCGSFHTNGLVVRKRLFERTGPFAAELRMCQDWDMWLKMAALGRLMGASLDRPVSMRRLHPDNRIFKDRRSHDRYRLAMWRSLVCWSRATPDARGARALYLDGLLHQGMQMSRERIAPLRLASNAQFLLRLPVRNGRVLRNRDYWAAWWRVVGGRKLRSLAGRLFSRTTSKSTSNSMSAPAVSSAASDRLGSPTA